MKIRSMRRQFFVDGMGGGKKHNFKELNPLFLDFWERAVFLRLVALHDAKARHLAIHTLRVGRISVSARTE